MRKMEKVLSTENLKKAFGGLVVADSINFTVYAKEVRCIIGPNGAGKTTFFNLLTGLIAVDSGTIWIRNMDVTRYPVYKREQLGLVRTFQAPRIFPHLTVRDNIMLGLRSRATILSFARRMKPTQEDEENIDQVLFRTRLADFGHLDAGSLSHGEKKRVEMAMALIQNPEVLLMDEPTAGMTVRETMEIAELIDTIRKDMSIVIVEHDMDFVREIADSLSVLHRGSLVREGTLEQIENDPFIQEIYLGSVQV